MKTTRKLLLALVLVMSILMTLAVAVIPASAAKLPSGTKLYLETNDKWNEAGARFAAYFFGDGEAWVSMTKVNGNVYECTVPNSGKNYTNVIFCRMNPSAAENNWNNKWAQTGDLVYDGTKNLYKMTSGSWDAGTW